MLMVAALMPFTDAKAYGTVELGTFAVATADRHILGNAIGNVTVTPPLPLVAICPH